MKKITIAGAIALMFISSASITFAATGTSANGATLTITDSNAGNTGGFTFNPSPRVSLGYNIDTNGDTFAINGQSDLTDTTNGIEYGMASDANGVFQRKKANDSLSAPSQADKSAFNGWSGGGGS